MRKPFIFANWKMHKTVQESVAFVKAIKDHLPDPKKVEVGIAGQALALYSMHEAAGRSGFRIIAQNDAPQLSGPFTEEISMRGLNQARVSHVMLGHIERRRLFNERMRLFIRRLKPGVTPIVCTDETMIQREMNSEIHYV